MTATDQALSILAHLNMKSDRRFTPMEAHLKFIKARIADTNGDIDGIKVMIDRQVAKWKGTDMEEYLRPQTLFNATKFASYYDDREQPVHFRVLRSGYLKPNPVREIADHRNSFIVGGGTKTSTPTRSSNPWDRVDQPALVQA